MDRGTDLEPARSLRSGLLRVAVVGAGGIGGYYGGLIARAGHPVGMLARGEHLRAIESRGLEIREPGGSFVAKVRASERVEDLLPSDLALVTVKSYSIPEVAPAVRRLAEEGAIVLPLLNGVEAFESLAQRGVPEKQILDGLTVISAAKIAPGVIERKSDFRSIVLGERKGGGSDRAERVATVLREAGVEVRVSTEIVVDLWRKFLFIASIAAACGLSRAPIGAVQRTPLGKLLLERAVGEIAAVARARGIALPPGEEASTVERTLALAPGLKPSFLLDLERGGPNELDVLSGAVSRLGREHGVPTPVHDTAVAAFSAATSL